MLIRSILISSLTTFAIVPAAAQAPTPGGASAPIGTAAPVSGFVSMNPLGLLTFGPNIEVEHTMTDQTTLSVGARLVSAGLVSHLINSNLQSAWTMSAALHAYPESSGLRGWFIGPRVELGKSTSTDDTANIAALAADFGRRWIRDNRFTFTLGGQVGAIRDWYTSRTDRTDTGREMYVFAMGVIGVGFTY